MSDLLEHLRRVTRDLEAAGASYALVGGMAVSLRVEPRFTRDLDIVVAVETDAQTEALARFLTGLGYTILAQSEQEARQRLATLRLAVPDSIGIVVDLLFASSGIEHEVVQQAEPIEALPGWTAPVARSEHLLAMKLLASDPTHRPQDMIDARSLLRTMQDEALDRTRDALQLIEQRGYNRTRHLGRLLDNLIRDHAREE